VHCVGHRITPSYTMAPDEICSSAILQLNKLSAKLRPDKGFYLSLWMRNPHAHYSAPT
jgi:hypothetical protein